MPGARPRAGGPRLRPPRSPSGAEASIRTDRQRRGTQSGPKVSAGRRRGGSSMLDLVIRGGTVVDGTGAPARRADVGVHEGRVVAMGTVDEAATEIDADGLMVTPGFVDLHTHYDAQLSWDPSASPSPLHGVTTVIGGNCGFSLAPPGPDDADYLSRMMARVEGMPLAALRSPRLVVGLVRRVAGPVRRPDRGQRRVPGRPLDAAPGRSWATMPWGPRPPMPRWPTMVALAERSLRGGGPRASRPPRPTPTMTATAGRSPPGPPPGASSRPCVPPSPVIRAPTLELIVPGCINGFTEDEVDLMAALSLLADRPVNWNVLGVSSLNPEACERPAPGLDRWPPRGGPTVVALTLPHTMKIRLSFEHGAVIDGLPGWREVFELQLPERMERLADPEVRRRLDAGAHSEEAGILGALADWEEPGHRGDLQRRPTPAWPGGRWGRSPPSGARSRSTPWSTWCWPTGCAPGCGLRSPSRRRDWALRAKVWQDPRTVVGGSDAGAHLDMMCGAVYSTSMLGDGVRKRGPPQLGGGGPPADRRARPALRPPRPGSGGRWLVGRSGGARPRAGGARPEHTRDDLPGGAGRLYAEAEGIEHVLVNGVRSSEPGSSPGRLRGPCCARAWTPTR